MVKKIFTVEIVVKDKAEKVISAGQILHAIVPIAETMSKTNLEGISVNEINEENNENVDPEPEEPIDSDENGSTDQEPEETDESGDE